mmetsp:Transcript_20783/g.52333  ORF Transcript_20783/g.52333 Transcript_20783/m.52333 type:complete len:1007 (-) Transcript_20783:330-3350(-)
MPQSPARAQALTPELLSRMPANLKQLRPGPALHYNPARILSSLAIPRAAAEKGSSRDVIFDATDAHAMAWSPVAEMGEEPWADPGTYCADRPESRVFWRAAAERGADFWRECRQAVDSNRQLLQKRLAGAEQGGEAVGGRRFVPPIKNALPTAEDEDPCSRTTARAGNTGTEGATQGKVVDTNKPLSVDEAGADAAAGPRPRKATDRGSSRSSLHQRGLFVDPSILGKRKRAHVDTNAEERPPDPMDAANSPATPGGDDSGETLRTADGPPPPPGVVQQEVVTAPDEADGAPETETPFLANGNRSSATERSVYGPFAAAVAEHEMTNNVNMNADRQRILRGVAILAQPPRQKNKRGGFEPLRTAETDAALPPLYSRGRTFADVLRAELGGKTQEFHFQPSPRGESRKGKASKPPRYPVAHFPRSSREPDTLHVFTPRRSEKTIFATARPPDTRRGSPFSSSPAQLPYNGAGKTPGSSSGWGPFPSSAPVQVSSNGKGDAPDFPARASQGPPSCSTSLHSLSPNQVSRDGKEKAPGSPAQVSHDRNGITSVFKVQACRGPPGGRPFFASTCPVQLPEQVDAKNGPVLSFARQTRLAYSNTIAARNQQERDEKGEAALMAFLKKGQNQLNLDEDTKSAYMLRSGYEGTRDINDNIQKLQKGIQNEREEVRAHDVGVCAAAVKTSQTPDEMLRVELESQNLVAAEEAAALSLGKNDSPQERAGGILSEGRSKHADDAHDDESAAKNHESGSEKSATVGNNATEQAMKSARMFCVEQLREGGGAFTSPVFDPIIQMILRGELDAEVEQAVANLWNRRTEGLICNNTSTTSTKISADERPEVDEAGRTTQLHQSEPEEGRAPLSASPLGACERAVGAFILKLAVVNKEKLLEKSRSGGAGSKRAQRELENTCSSGEVVEVPEEEIPLDDMVLEASGKDIACASADAEKQVVVVRVDDCELGEDEQPLDSAGEIHDSSATEWSCELEENPNTGSGLVATSQPFALFVQRICC